MKYQKFISLVLFLGLILFTHQVHASVESIFTSGNVVYQLKYTTTIKVAHENDPSLYLTKAYRQSNYLVGQLAYLKLRENGSATGAPLRKKEDVVITNINELDSTSAEITYAYNGEVVLDHSGLNHYTIYLPENYEVIDQLSVNEIAACSFAPGYVVNEDLLTFYWTPFNKYCKIPYQTVEASLTPVTAKVTYPDYPRLVKNGVVSVAVVVGKMDERSTNNPYGSDQSCIEYKEVVRKLYSLGLRITKSNIPRNQDLSSEETYEGTIGHLKMVVNLVFGNSIYLDKKPSLFDFYSHFMRLSQESSFVVYSGHAGFLLMPGSITFHSQFPLVLDQDRYQIFVINACQTDVFIHPLLGVKDSKNLDLFINGRESIINAKATTAMLNAISLWARNDTWTSYPELVRQMDSVDAMLGVVGEQDNPTEPYVPSQILPKKN